MTFQARLVGIDCAVQSKKMGIAVGALSDDSIAVESVQYGLPDPVQFIVNIMHENLPLLLALDAPLGWPASMGEVLVKHRAADRVPIAPNILFRRDTDRFVKRTIGKQSLDVGADRIARTACAAVDLLGEVRRLTGQSIPLAWGSSELQESCCIEVYPAATLEAHGFSSRGYKGDKPAHRDSRTKLFAELPGLQGVSDEMAQTIVSNDDAFDAVICLIAAADFLQGVAMKPENMDTARKEGWIWVRSKLQSDSRES